MARALGILFICSMAFVFLVKTTWFTLHGRMAMKWWGGPYFTRSKRPVTFWINLGFECLVGLALGCLVFWRLSRF